MESTGLVALTELSTEPAAEGNMYRYLFRICHSVQNGEKGNGKSVDGWAENSPGKLIKSGRRKLVGCILKSNYNASFSNGNADFMLWLGPHHTYGRKGATKINGYTKVYDIANMEISAFRVE